MVHMKAQKEINDALPHFYHPHPATDDRRGDRFTHRPSLYSYRTESPAENALLLYRSEFLQDNF